MGRNEDIDNAIWSDPDIEGLSANAMLLYLWSWTNPRCGMSGLYRVSQRTMTESKVCEEDIPATLDELAQGDFAFYDDSVLWVRSRVKRLRVKGSKMATAIAKDLRHIRPGHPLKVRFLETYGGHSWLRDALKETHSEPMENLSENPIGKGNSHNPSGTSPEVPRTGTWDRDKGQGEGTTTTDKVDLPQEFPDELRPHLAVVFRVLRDLARRHNAKAVAPLALAAVVMGRQHKPLVRAAYDFVGWADGQASRRKDVVSGYRNWLDRVDDLEGFEQLDAGGFPSSPPASRNPNHVETSAEVLARHRRRESPSELIRAINGEAA